MGRPAEARTRRGLTPRQGHLIRTYLKIEGGSRSGLKKSPPLGDAALRQFSSCGRLLIAAKEKLKPGEFLEMTVRDLPFTERTAQRLMAIARDERLTQFSSPNERRAKWTGMRQTLKPGGLLILQGYMPKQIEYATVGPKQIQNLYTREMLEEAFSDFDDLRIVEEEREIIEGTSHLGMSALIGLTGRKPKRQEH